MFRSSIERSGFSRSRQIGPTACAVVVGYCGSWVSPSPFRNSPIPRRGWFVRLTEKSWFRQHRTQKCRKKLTWCVYVFIKANRPEIDTETIMLRTPTITKGTMTMCQVILNRELTPEIKRKDKKHERDKRWVFENWKLKWIGMSGRLRRSPRRSIEE